MREVLSPSNPVRRKLSTLVPAIALDVGVPLPLTGPPGDRNVVLMPRGMPAVVAGLKYGVLRAFSISARKSNVAEPHSLNFFEMPRSKRNRPGPLTTSV